MKIKFLKGVVAFGRDCKQGEILEVVGNEYDTKYLLANGYAEEVKEEESKIVKRVIKKRLKRVVE